MNNATIYTIAKEAATVLQLNEVRVRFPVSNDWLDGHGDMHTL